MNERENFGSRIGFILVSAGCAVGLGNVWKFPYICGEYGGAAFVLIYLIFLIMLGLPILICEFSIGRASKSSIVYAFEKLEQPGNKWHKYRWFGMIGNYLLMMFYTMVGGWMLYYAYIMALGKLNNVSSDKIENEFSQLLASPGKMFLSTMIIVLIAFFICYLGLKNGVEKITSIMMSLLIILILILVIKSLSLDGAMEGVKFYLVPNFNNMVEKGIGNVVFAAMSHAFFTLSIGMGTMEIFGSYLTKQHKITGQAIQIVLLDTFIALMAGLITIPACFAYNITPDSGPSLLFHSLTNVFNDMKGGRIYGTCFFIFMSFAAISTIVAVFENIIAMYGELFSTSRRKSIAINFILITILSIPAILGYNKLDFINPLGGATTIMDFEDFLVSYNLLPLGSLFFILFCCKRNGWGFSNFIKETNTGEGISFPVFLKKYMTYVLPCVIVFIYLKGYYDMFKDKGLTMLIIFMIISILFLALILSFTLKKGKKQNINE